MDIKTIDKDGQLYRVRGEFPIIDYHREGGQVALYPGRITRLKASDFLKSQPGVFLCNEDGEEIEAEAEAKVEPKKPAKP